MTAKSPEKPPKQSRKYPRKNLLEIPFRKGRALGLALGLCAGLAPGQTPVPVWTHVEPQIGTAAGGYAVPGAKVPFGLVYLSPDCGNKEYNNGYMKNGNGGDMHGFSHVHVSGTGGGAKYGNILVSPQNGALATTGYVSKYGGESFSAAYYAVTLTKYNVRCELTATARVGVHRYTFPEAAAGGPRGRILFDLGSFLVKVISGEEQHLVANGMEITGPTSARGWHTVRGGWNKGGPYTVYFEARWDAPATKTGVFRGATVLDSQKVEDKAGKGVGGYAEFASLPNGVLNLKVGISFKSLANAAAHLQEAPDFDFEKVRDAGRAKWEDALSRIRITGATEDQNKIFYSAFYRSLLQPTDRTGDNPGWTSSEPYYDDYYALWDTFRTLHPLLTLTHTARQRDMVRSLVDIYKNEGWLPDARSGNFTGRTQGGSHADVVIADAFVKGITGIDWSLAYEGMVKNAEVPPPADKLQYYGRGGILQYNRLGYVPVNFERSGTRTLEYGPCDYGLARLAQGLGKTADFQKYSKRARNWLNLWNPEVSHEGFSGFIMPKDSLGAWKNISPAEGGSWGSVFYEGSSWTNSLYVPQDPPALIRMAGGDETFLRRLGVFFEKYFEASNEPGFFTPYLAAWAKGGYARMVDWMITEQRNLFRRAANGIPGNDDSGAMSSMYLFTAMGFMPNAGWDYYLLTSPLFPGLQLKQENGKTFEVKANGLSAANRYIVSAKWNGQAFNQGWIRHAEILKGGVLELEMGAAPSSWPTGPVPPSMSQDLGPVGLRAGMTAETVTGKKAQRGGLLNRGLSADGRFRGPEASTPRSPAR